MRFWSYFDQFSEGFVIKIRNMIKVFDAETGEIMKDDATGEAVVAVETHYTDNAGEI